MIRRHFFEFFIKAIEIHQQNFLFCFNLAPSQETFADVGDGDGDVDGDGDGEPLGANICTTTQ